MKQHIGIIGGGIAGLMTGYYALKQGFRVSIFEQNLCGQGCSQLAAGMLAPANELEFQELELLHAGIESRNLYLELAEQIGASKIGLDKQGTLEIGIEKDDIGFLERLYQFQLEHKLPVEWKSKTEMLSLEPHLSSRATAGIYSPFDIQVDNRKLLSVLIEAIKHLGGNILEQTKIENYRVQPRGEIQLASKEKKFIVDSLLITVGYSTNELPLPYKIYPVRGEMLSLSPTHTLSLKHVIRIHNQSFGKAYLVPKADRMLIGSTSEEQGNSRHNTAGGLLDILRKTYAAVPGLYDAIVLETWAGLRPATLSRMPVIDKEKDKPVYHINGLYRHGILLAPYAAKKIVEAIQAGATPKVPKAFQIPLFG